jgi:hypothetical protein
MQLQTSYHDIVNVFKKLIPSFSRWGRVKVAAKIKISNTNLSLVAKEGHFMKLDVSKNYLSQHISYLVAQSKIMY